MWQMSRVFRVLIWIIHVVGPLHLNPLQFYKTILFYKPILYIY